MARRTEDPRVTDLRRYRKARELQRRQPPPRPRRESLLGGRPRAGLILALVVLALVAAWFLPMLLGAG
jgi:hypothetical protein